MNKFAVIILFFALITGCKKQDDDPTPQLLKKTWKLYAQDVITPLQGTALDGSSQHWYGPDYSPGCYTEMLWIYQDNSKLEIQDDTACITPGTTGIYYSNWQLTNDNKSINISGVPFGTFTYSIISITGEKLIVQKQEKVGYANGGIIDLLIQYEYNSQ